MGRTAYDVIKGSSPRWLMMQLQEKRSAFSLLIIGLLRYTAPAEYVREILLQGNVEIQEIQGNIAS